MDDERKRYGAVPVGCDPANTKPKLSPWEDVVRREWRGDAYLDDRPSPVVGWLVIAAGLTIAAVIMVLV